MITNRDARNNGDNGIDFLQVRKSNNFYFGEQSNHNSILQIRETDSSKVFDSALSLIKEKPTGVPQANFKIDMNGRYNEPMF